MRRIVLGLMLLALSACTKSLTPDVLQQYQARTLYTCCNLHVEGETHTDVNYYVGSLIPVGSPVQVQDAGTRGSLGVLVDGRKVNLYHSYGAQQESFQQYLDKILVPDDPKGKMSLYPKAAQEAIRDSRVEVGMTKEQVLMSVGYPPTHRTPSIASNDWTYWYNRWVTFRVNFDEGGRVSGIVGTNAPTQNKPIKDDPPPPPPARKPAPKKKR